MRRFIPITCLVMSVCACDKPPKGGLLESTKETAADTAPVKEAKVDGPINHNPRVVVERAIQAHGGPVRLGELRQYQRSETGRMIQKGSFVTCAREVIAAMPDKCLLHFDIDAGTQKQRTTMAVAGNVGWLAGAGTIQDLPQGILDDLRGEAHLLNISTLLPLAAMELTALPEILIKDEPALGIKVVAPGQADVKLWFDKKTGYLVKAERPGFEGEPITRAYYFSGFKDFKGVTLPTRQLQTMNGALQVDWTITDYKLLDALPADAFTKPK